MKKFLLNQFHYACIVIISIVEIPCSLVGIVTLGRVVVRWDEYLAHWFHNLYLKLEYKFYGGRSSL